MTKRMIALLLLLAVGASGASQSIPTLSVWLDEYAFRQHELSLMEHVITAAATPSATANDTPSVFTIAGRTVSRVIQPKGHKMLHKHTLLWTGRDGCYAAFRQRSLSITNTISCTPGTEAITGKATLIHTLHTHYTHDTAATIMPTAFLLPSQYNAFASHLRHTRFQGIWALKRDVHRGQGVVAVPAPQALRRALDNQSDPVHRYVVAQKFVEDQLLINNRPFVMRVWAVVGGGAPVVRSFLYNGGIVLFGDDVVEQHTKGADPQRLVVNIFQQNRSAVADPWSVSDLRAYLHESNGNSDAVFTELWDIASKSAAAVVAAAVPAIRKATSPPRLPYYQGGNVEVLGIDFVVDSSSKRPWLVEVNHLPSMARKILDCIPALSSSSRGGEEGEKKDPNHHPTVCKDNPMDTEKEAFLAAFLRVLAARQQVVALHADKAKKAVASYGRTNNNDNVPLPAPLSSEFVRQVLDVQVERQAALDHGFTDLTPHVYSALECMKEHVLGSSKEKGKNSGAAACEIGAVVPPPPPSASSSTLSPNPMHPSVYHYKEWVVHWIEWGMAQFRMAVLVLNSSIDKMSLLYHHHVTRGGGGGNAGGNGGGGRNGLSPLSTQWNGDGSYVPLVEDALMREWLKDSGTGNGGDAQDVLETLQRFLRDAST